ncbi:phosphatidyl inositol kinase, partial [Nowakowskiella sp. JEL0078]
MFLGVSLITGKRRQLAQNNEDDGLQPASTSAQHQGEAKPAFTNSRILNLSHSRSGSNVSSYIPVFVEDDPDNFDATARRLSNSKSLSRLTKFTPSTTQNKTKEVNPGDVREFIRQGKHQKDTSTLISKRASMSLAGSLTNFFGSEEPDCDVIHKNRDKHKSKYRMNHTNSRSSFPPATNTSKDPNLDINQSLLRINSASSILSSSMAAITAAASSATSVVTSSIKFGSSGAIITSNSKSSVGKKKTKKSRKSRSNIGYTSLARFSSDGEPGDSSEDDEIEYESNEIHGINYSTTTTPPFSGTNSPHLSRALSHTPSIQNLPEQQSNTIPIMPEDSLVNLSDDYINVVPPITPVNSDEFIAIIEEVRLAIAERIYPTRIEKGSSGSYFARNRKNEIVGVFKPKNEEPYGKLNPKWVKWLHRTFLPCCFGRSCIIPNLGYISEAAASYMDRRLELNIVPRTEVVLLSSPTFFYPKSDRDAYEKESIPLPPKLGSFQLFLKSYKDATTFFRDGYEVALGVGSKLSLDESEPPVSSMNPENWSELTKKQFQWGFERLVIIDYLIRNTDRGMDNWMVRYSPESEKLTLSEDQNSVKIDIPEQTSGVSTYLNSGCPSPQQTNKEASLSSTSKATNSTETEYVLRRYGPEPNIRVAGIDNGLAFPFKHPDRFRSYPYGWSVLPCSRVTFSKETRDHVLYLLLSDEWWEETLAGLERLFRIDPDFSAKMWKKQKAVIRGESWNIVEVLRRSETVTQNSQSVGAKALARGSPWALARRPVVCVFDDNETDEFGDIEHEGLLQKGKKTIKKAKQR